MLDAAGPLVAAMEELTVKEAGPGGSVVSNTAGLDVPRECIGPF